MAEQKEKKLKEDDLKLLEESKKKREEVQRYQIEHKNTHTHLNEPIFSVQDDFRASLSSTSFRHMHASFFIAIVV